MRKLLIAGLLVLLVLIAIPLYFRLGWDRMADECDAFRPGDHSLDQVVPFGEDGTGSRSVSFSWHPRGGFTCTYSNGYERTSYWF